MSKADKIFKELGYEKSYTELNNIKYYKNDDNVIYFMKEKSILKSGEYDSMYDYITTQGLKAINEKIKELGWLNE